MKPLGATGVKVAIFMVVMLMPASLITSVSFFDPVMPCSIAASKRRSARVASPGWRTQWSIAC